MMKRDFMNSLTQSFYIFVSEMVILVDDGKELQDNDREVRDK